MSFLLGAAIVWLVTTLIFGIGMEIIILTFNGVIDESFQNFNQLTTMFNKLLNAGSTPIDPGVGGTANAIDIAQIIIGISITFIAIVLIYSVIKNMVSPLTGNESENPMAVVLKAIFAAFLIACYPEITKMIINFLNDVTKLEIFDTQLRGNLLNSMNIAFSATLSFELILNAILMITLLASTVGVAITYAERYLSFALYIMIGPLCIAMYPNKSTRNITQEWIKGVFSQIFAILLSMFVLTLAGKQLENIDIFNGTGLLNNQGNAIGLTVATQFIVLIALLNIVKNSEKYINMLGLRTIPNSDTARDFMHGALTTMGLATQLPRMMSHMSNSSLGRKYGSNKQSLIGNTMDKDFSKSGKSLSPADMKDVKGSAINAQDFADAKKKISNTAADKLNEAQARNGYYGADSKNEFKKHLNENGIEYTNGAYETYKNAKEETLRARNSVNEQITSNSQMACGPLIDRNGIPKEAKIDGKEFGTAIGRNDIIGDATCVTTSVARDQGVEMYKVRTAKEVPNLETGGVQTVYGSELIAVPKEGIGNGNVTARQVSTILGDGGTYDNTALYKTNAYDKNGETILNDRGDPIETTIRGDGYVNAKIDKNMAYGNGTMSLSYSNLPEEPVVNVPQNMADISDSYGKFDNVTNNNYTNNVADNYKATSYGSNSMSPTYTSVPEPNISQNVADVSGFDNQIPQNYNNVLETTNNNAMPDITNVHNYESVPQANVGNNSYNDASNVGYNNEGYGQNVSNIPNVNEASDYTEINYSGNTHYAEPSATNYGENMAFGRTEVNNISPISETNDSNFLGNLNENNQETNEINVEDIVNEINKNDELNGEKDANNDGESLIKKLFSKKEDKK